MSIQRALVRFAASTAVAVVGAVGVVAVPAAHADGMSSNGCYAYYDYFDENEWAGKGIGGCPKSAEVWWQLAIWCKRGNGSSYTAFSAWYRSGQSTSNTCDSGDTAHDAWLGVR